MRLAIRNSLLAVWALVAMAAAIAGCGGCALLGPEGEAHWFASPAAEVAR